MKKMRCPICHAINEVPESTVGCYVLCAHCPHRFYVPAPRLGEDFSDSDQNIPNVVPDYKAMEKLFSNRDQGIEELVQTLRWQRTAMSLLVASQFLIVIIVLVVLVLVWR